MEELTSNEMESVSGGLGWGSGGALVMSIGAMSPVTIGFGFAIGGAMLLIDYYQN